MARAKAPAGPWGGFALRKVRQELASRGWACGLTVLTGEDGFHLDAAQKAILAHLLPGEASAFGLTVLGRRAVDVAEVVETASSAGMFAPRRVVLVAEVEALAGDAGPLEAYAAHPPAESFVIVRAPKLDQRRAIQKELARVGRTLLFAAPTPRDEEAVLREIEDLGRDRGLALDRGASEGLLAVCGGDFHRIASELDKLREWTGPRDDGAVRREDLLGVVAGSGALSGWELADAILNRDLRAGLAAARRLVGEGEEPIRLLGGLAYRARTLLQGKSLLDAGEAPEKVVEALRAWRYGQGLVAGLGRYTLRELLAFPSRLLQADRQLKSRSISPLAVIESLTVDLTRPAARAPNR